jgi:Gpi18-like mannosyltransferase
MSVLSLRRQLLYALLFYVLLLVLLPSGGYLSDLHYWVSWASYSFKYGLGNVYQLPDNNYNPLYHYVLWGFGQLVGNPARIAEKVHWLKAFTLVFDFAGAFWAASLVPERERRFGLALLLLLNVGYLYNTLVWGQVDAIYTFFAFGGIVLATQQRTVASTLCFVLALAAKTQAIIFLPPLLLLWAPVWWRQPSRLLQAVAASAVLAGLVLAPFIWAGAENYLPRILAINRRAAEVYPVVAMGAYNLWHLLPGRVGDSDLRPLAGLTYRGWGLIMFGAAAAVALLPLGLRALRRLRQPPPTLATPASTDLALVLLSSGLIPLLFTFFNTQMHERYWHAAVLFLAAYGFVRRNYLPYALVSVAYLLNMENILRFAEGVLPYSVFFFKSWFSAALFGLLIIICLVKLYRLAAGMSVELAGQLGAESAASPDPAKASLAPRQGAPL